MQIFLPVLTNNDTFALYADELTKASFWPRISMWMEGENMGNMMNELIYVSMDFLTSPHALYSIYERDNRNYKKKKKMLLFEMCNKVSRNVLQSKKGQ